MIDPDEPSPGGYEFDPVLLELTEQITQRLQAGDLVDPADYIDRYPRWARTIRGLLPTMNVLVKYGRAVGQDRDNHPIDPEKEVGP